MSSAYRMGKEEEGVLRTSWKADPRLIPKYHITKAAVHDEAPVWTEYVAQSALIRLAIHTPYVEQNNQEDYDKDECVHRDGYRITEAGKEYCRAKWGEPETATLGRLEQILIRLFWLSFVKRQVAAGVAGTSLAVPTSLLFERIEDTIGYDETNWLKVLFRLIALDYLESSQESTLVYRLTAFGLEYCQAEW